MIESSCVDYASFDFELVNPFTDGKDREIPRRVPAAQGLSLGHSSTSIPPRIAVTTPLTGIRPLAAEELAAMPKRSKALKH